MRTLLSLVLLVAISCNQGSMSEEQRQQLKEEKASRKIQRVSDADILNAAKSQAEVILQSDDSDAVAWIALSDSTVSGFQKQMQEAYQYAFDNQLDLFDNIEETEAGEIVFTRPESRNDSTKGFWMITLDKKEVIKSMQ